MSRVLLPLLIAQLLAAGCSPYALRGRVVEGAPAGVEVVRADDPRLVSRPPLPEVRLALAENPQRLNRRDAGNAVSGPDGWFELRPDVAGAGVLRIDAGLEARRQGFAPAVGFFPLPGRGKRVLVTMPVGRDRSASPTDFLDETLRQARPYLD
ncbi:hypothetical protein [Phycisphaera mikurensis]|uniref:Lipoprotein n=1 Tax=Phycisphaera mikurensis (strain NBRC 102666 / KCTC 22515 / FYK2301M01) TaxID=1142394 RepID=I0IJ27_PHYMF|nr:hypothetical protein [Phycisphaera mikurensis]MBB6443112.1 hypothetical protein [Phycisphaera mikurensis]BAM05265.1 hypothetical protein PSMK_31060 [Phycisphaera mikurensis NBRC 102666]